MESPTKLKQIPAAIHEEVLYVVDPDVKEETTEPLQQGVFSESKNSNELQISDELAETSSSPPVNKSRPRLPPLLKQQLLKFFNNDQSLPACRKRRLAEQCGISESRVASFFANEKRRRKHSYGKDYFYTLLERMNQDLQTSLSVNHAPEEQPADETEQEVEGKEGEKEATKIQSQQLEICNLQSESYCP